MRFSKFQARQYQLLYIIVLFSLCSIIAGKVAEKSSSAICKETKKQCKEHCECYNKMKPIIADCDKDTLEMSCLCHGGYTPDTKEIFFDAIYYKCDRQLKKCAAECKDDAECKSKCEKEFSCLETYSNKGKSMATHCDIENDQNTNPTKKDNPLVDDALGSSSVGQSSVSALALLIAGGLIITVS